VLWMDKKLFKFSHARVPTSYDVSSDERSGARGPLRRYNGRHDRLIETNLFTYCPTTIVFDTIL